MSYSNMYPRGSWALKHLNWAFILYSWLALLPVYVILLTGSHLGNDIVLFIGIMGCFLAVVSSWYLAVWNLKHKGRSLWNLLYLLLGGIGSIIFLCVQNRDQLALEDADNRR